VKEEEEVRWGRIDANGDAAKKIKKEAIFDGILTAN
jgi:hypothetical protein